MAAPDSQERPQTLPPCNEPAPWDKDDRLVWTLRCGIARHLPPDAAALFRAVLDSIGNWSSADRSAASLGFATGFKDGVGAAVTSAISDLIGLVRGALSVVASAGEAMVSERTWNAIATMLRSPPGPETQQAVEAAMTDIAADDPEFVEAVVGVSLAIIALRRLVEWVGADPAAAGWTVVLWVTNAIGELLGDVAAEVAAATSPADVGAVMGDYCGRLLVEVLRVEWGI